jgi:class 3 adenylate cyclase/tetratricopeptide (TPR) repeat protein
VSDGAWIGHGGAVGDELELPEGPVTIMFTDLEGSTALRTSLGDTAADQLFQEHQDLVRGLIESHRGHDLEAALGDGFLAVFASTRRALTCAVAIQQALDEFNRARAGAPLRVRIGCNTGEVAWQKGQPSGEAVHAAARVCAAASGGEVFVSDVTRQLAGTMPDVTFSDRGDFDLKGFPEPWRLWSLSWRASRPPASQDVFVGREPELEELRRHLRRALDGHGGLVLIGGEPGVGKTTLVKRLIEEAQQQGAVALLGRCYESDGTVPYSPFVETTEQALHDVPAEWVREDLGEDAAEVARMVPELRRRFADIGEPLDLPPEQQRRYFFNAIMGFITRASNRLPLVLVVDDAHWADEPTLLLVEHVAERLSGLPVLALGTYRDVELDVSRPLAASLERLLRGRLAHRVALRRFDRAGVARALEARLGTEPTDELVDVIYEETEGNPFFVDEVVRHLDEEGKLFDEAGGLRTAAEIGDVEVPESVRLVVGRRVERLGPDAQRVLAAGAVVGRAFDFDLLERIAGVDVATLLDVVDDAERARVIVPEQRGGRVVYTFGHELIRQTLLGSLSLPRRQRLHLAVADALEQLDPAGAETRPSEIADHLVQAGSAAPVERTVAYLQRTAERALQAAAFEEALRASESTLALLPADAGLPRLEALERVGWAERALGRFDQCMETWNEVIEGYVALGEPHEASRLLWELGYHLIWMGRFEEAVASYHRGISVLDDRPSGQRAGLTGGLAALSGLAGFYDLSRSQSDEALAAAAAVGDDHQTARIRWGRSIAGLANLRLDVALEEGEAAVEGLRACGDLWTLIDALGWFAFPMLIRGRPEPARAVAQEAVDLGVRLGHRTGELLARRVTLLADAWQGAITPPDLLIAVREDVAAMAAIRSPWQSQSHGWASIILTLQGNLDEGLAAADRAVELEPLSGFGRLAVTYRLLNRAYAQDGAACRAMLDAERDALLSDFDTMGSGTAMALTAAAEACVLLRWETELEGLYPRLDALAREELLPVRTFDVASNRRVAGMAAMALERWDDARDHLEAARLEMEAAPNAVEGPVVLHRRAELALRRPGLIPGVDGRALLHQAIEGYRRLGWGPLLEAAEALAAAT